MSRRRRGRSVSGIVLLDKPAGRSSNHALQAVRRLFEAAKAGHTGSLDPLATGMLPVCLGQATKLSGYLLDADKVYQVTARLGQQTNTADVDGEVTGQADWQHVTRAALDAALLELTGDIDQIPPMYSAIKHEGQRLYKLARAGKDVERKSRRVTIHALELLDWRGDELELRVHCSKGTYVRTLVEDIAARLGTLAHVQALRRLQVGPFDGAMHSLEALEQTKTDGGLEALDALILPPAVALTGWPRVSLDDNSAFYFKRGQAVLVPDAPRDGEVAVFDEAGNVIGIGICLDDGRVNPRRLLVSGAVEP